MSGVSNDVEAAEEEAPRDDDVLPESLFDAIDCAAKATANAFGNGTQRCISEILVEGFWDTISGPVFADDGDTERWWELNRRYIEGLIAEGKFDKVRVYFPDMGVVAMLTQKWPDATFEMAHLGTRNHTVPEDTELVVFSSPDPQGAEDVQKICGSCSEQGTVIAIFNPRLASGDVGVGLSVRRLRSRFLSTFETTYSIRPISGIGAVFKCYPSLWKVFVNDENDVGRYKLVAEEVERPGGDSLDDILIAALAPKDEDGNAQQGIFGQIGRTIGGLARFMGSL
jgi:hypothetical protein